MKINYWNWIWCHYQRLSVTCHIVKCISNNNASNSISKSVKNIRVLDTLMTILTYTLCYTTLICSGGQIEISISSYRVLSGSECEPSKTTKFWIILFNSVSKGPVLYAWSRISSNLDNFGNKYVLEYVPVENILLFSNFDKIGYSAFWKISSYGASLYSNVIYS